MEDAGGLAHGALGEAEVEGIVTAGDTNLVKGALLHGDAPASAPTEFAEVDGAVLFVRGVGTFEREPGIGLIAGGTAAALNDLASDIERRGLQLPLAGPVAGEPVGTVVAVLEIGKTPGGAGGVFEDDVFFGLILDGGPALEHALSI